MTASHYALIDDVTPNRATVDEVRAAMLRVGSEAVVRDRPMALGERIWIGAQSMSCSDSSQPYGCNAMEG